MYILHPFRETFTHKQQIASIDFFFLIYQYGSMLYLRVLFMWPLNFSCSLSLTSDFCIVRCCCTCHLLFIVKISCFIGVMILNLMSATYYSLHV